MSHLGVSPPSDYVAFMSETNGAEGFLSDNGYLLIDPIELLIPCSEAYAQDGECPDLIIFGSNGGGTVYAFDKRNADVQIVAADPISMDLGPVEYCGRTFHEFLAYLKSSHQD